MTAALSEATARGAGSRGTPKLWMPKRVLITPSALAYPHGREMAERAAALGADVIETKRDALTGLRGADERETYVRAKSTLGIVVSPPGRRKLQPIPPSADWQFHLAEGCPAHCQYCYLAGSLSGPPIVRAFANVDEILDGLPAYLGRGTVTSESAERAGEGTTFEASCYTDPLGIEHITGSLARAIRYFGAWEAPVQLRWTTKFDGVEPLLALDHRRRTRIRFSVNARSIAQQFEGGTAFLGSRIAALRRVAEAGYPVGLTVAPIMPVDAWRDEYDALFRAVGAAVADVPELDLTVELITHRFTPGSKSVLRAWYPATKLDLDENARAQKRTKFGSLKYVYRREVMRELREFIEDAIARRLPAARVLYWT